MGQMQPFYAFTKGENCNISPLIHPTDQPSLLNGCHNCYRLGEITKDTGYKIIGAQTRNKSVGGLFNFIQVPGTEKMLQAVTNAGDTATELYYSTGSTWTEIADAETAWNSIGHKIEMESFIGYCFFVGHNGTTFLPVGSLTGTTFSTATCVTNMPQAKYIKRYRDRLYLANCYTGAAAYPYRVYFSSVPSAGAITWTAATDYFDVDYSDQITGIGENWDRLIVFTDYNAYMYDQDQKKKVWSTGCSNHRTIKNSGAYMIWANGDGVWISTGGQPQNIGGEIMDFLKNSDPRTWFSELIDETYYLYLGTVTVKGVTYANLVKAFDIGKSNWWGRELGHAMTAFARYNSSGKSYLWMGSTAGKVYEKGKYTDTTLLSADDDLPIGSNFELPPISLSVIDKEKKLRGIIAYANRAQGLKLKARAIDRSSRILTPYRPLGELINFINPFDTDAKDGVFIQIAGSENSTKPYWSFYGIALDLMLHSKVMKERRT